MTRNTSSRSVKATPKMAEEPDTNGIPLTDPSSETTSEKSTKWLIRRISGDEIHLRVEGGRGRVSFTSSGRSGGEARFYRNETTKVFDAVITGVESILSDRCTWDEIPPAPKIKFSSAGTRATSSFSASPGWALPADDEPSIEELPPWETKE